MKTCTKCGEEKPLEAFSNNVTKKDGKHSQCRACMAAYRQEHKDIARETNRAYRDKNRDAIREQELAYRQRNKEARSEYERAYRQRNKEAKAEWGRKYRQGNKEARYEYQLAYRQENKAAITEQRRAYRQENKEARSEYQLAYRQENKAAVTERQRAHHQRNRDKIKARRSQLRGHHAYVEGGATEEEVLAVLEQQAGLCANKFCGCELTEENRRLNYKTPVARGGSAWPENLQWLCKPCSKSKSARTQEEWMAVLAGRHIKDLL